MPLFLLLSSCNEKSQYEIVREYLNKELKVGFDIQGKTYIVISTHQCLPCVKTGVEIIKKAENTKIIIGAISEKKAFFLLGDSITKKNHVIVDTELAMENIPLFSDNLYVRFDIENQEIVNLQKISISSLMK